MPAPSTPFSAIRMPFFVTRPISMIMPIWLKMLRVSPKYHSAKRAPKSAGGALDGGGGCRNGPSTAVEALVLAGGEQSLTREPRRDLGRRWCARPAPRPGRRRPRCGCRECPRPPGTRGCPSHRRCGRSHLGGFAEKPQLTGLFPPQADLAREEGLGIAQSLESASRVAEQIPRFCEAEPCLGLGRCALCRFQQVIGPPLDPPRGTVPLPPLRLPPVHGRGKRREPGAGRGRAHAPRRWGSNRGGCRFRPDRWPGHRAPDAAPTPTSSRIVG